MSEKMLSHATTHEIAFINGLRLPTLQRYAQAIDSRSDWGAVDPAQVKSHCVVRIKQLQKRLIKLEP